MKQISLLKSYISPRSVWNVCKLLIRSNRGGYLGEGPEVKAFEREFGEQFGFTHVAAVNSGTAALEIAYDLVGVGQGDEVVVPVLTHPATGLPAVRRGASVVFADVDSDLNVSVEDVKRKVSPKTKAVFFVHFGGNNRGLRELLEFTKERGIYLIEDAAQAIGSDFWGKADITCVSLQAVKTLTSGDGGFLICKKDEHHEKAKRLRWFGYDRELKQRVGDTDIYEAGYKYHMNDIAAAIGRGNLRMMPQLIAHRRRLIEVYRQEGIQANIWLAVTYSERRDALREHLAQHGIAAGLHHYRNDQYTVFGGRRTLPGMDAREPRYLFLPLHHGVSVGDVRRIASLIRAFEGMVSSA